MSSLLPSPPKSPGLSAAGEALENGHHKKQARCPCNFYHSNIRICRGLIKVHSSTGKGLISDTEGRRFDSAVLQNSGGVVHLFCAAPAAGEETNPTTGHTQTPAPLGGVSACYFAWCVVYFASLAVHRV